MSQYDMSLDLTTKNSLSVIIERIRFDSKILEFGPSYGRLTHFLKKQMNCEIYCVEIDKNAAKETSKYSQKMIIGDIESLDWEKEMGIIPDYICDNDINKHGKEVESYIIHNPEILFNQDEEFIVIITSSFIDEIKSQLAKYPNIKEVYSYNEISYKLKTE